MSNDTSLDLDFLTASFDDLPVAASYRIPPSGVYGLTVSASYGLSKTSNKAMVTVNYEVTEIVNQTDAGEQPAIIGDKFSRYFMWGDPRGMADLQAFLAPFVTHFGMSRPAELLCSESNPNGAIKDIAVVGTVKRTPRRDKATKAIIDGEYFVDVKDVQIV